MRGRQDEVWRMISRNSQFKVVNYSVNIFCQIVKYSVSLLLLSSLLDEKEEKIKMEKMII